MLMLVYFICLVDQLATLPKSTWQSLLGAALTSYHKLLLIKQLGHSETSNFLRLAKRHKTSLQVLSAVADFLDSVFRYIDLHISNAPNFLNFDNS